MEWPLFIAAIGLLFVFEGLLPFLSPRYWRGIMQQLFIQPDRFIRIMGFLSMLIGLVLVYSAHYLY